MKAMILAAGLGTRLRPLTNEMPKALLDVGGRPLIAYPLLQLRHVGVREVVINVHHHAAKLKLALGDGSRFGLRIIYSEEPELLDTGGGVFQARRWLDDTFFVLNGDTIQDMPLHSLASFHRERVGIASMVLRDDAEAARYGLLDFDRDGRIRRFRGEPANWPTPLMGMMYAGVSIWEPRLFTHLKPGPCSLTRDAIPALMSAGEAIFAFPYAGYWRVVDSPSDLERARSEAISGQRLSYVSNEIS